MSRLSDVFLAPGKPRKHDHHYAEWGEQQSPVVPFTPTAGQRPDPTPLTLNYHVRLNDAVYSFRGRTILAVTWEVAPTVHTTDATETRAVVLECFIVYRTLPSYDDYRVHGSLPKRLLESDRPERAFGRAGALRPPRWFAAACRDLLHEFEAHWARQKLAGRH